MSEVDREMVTVDGLADTNTQLWPFMIMRELGPAIAGSFIFFFRSKIARFLYKISKFYIWTVGLLI